VSYADGLLSTGERILHRSRPHPLIVIRGARWTMLAAVVATFLFWLGGTLGPEGVPGELRSLLGWVTLVVFIGGLALLALTALRYASQEIVLTDRRVIQVEGVLNRNSTDSSLEKINDAVLHQSIFGRLFDFGDLTVLTASRSGIERLRMLRDPITFKKALLEAKHEFQVEMQRAERVPSPPIREGGGTSGPAGAIGPAATALPASAASAKVHPDGMARTLANLADLRDRGVITAGDYDRKKADLLSRL